jgi:hypothetical protein
MDLPRFVSILATRRLWFSKASLFSDDPYEGFCIATPIDMPSDPDDAWLGLSERLREDAARTCEKAREHLCVNSWCLAESESMAMWEIYGDHGCGVAVKSSIKQYKLAAKLEPPMLQLQYAFGNVTYHANLDACSDIRKDFTVGTSPINLGIVKEVLKLGFHKRACYEHEREWRAVMYQDEAAVHGCDVDFDFDTLITMVTVGPRAVDFVFEAVASLLEKFALRKPLEHSRLLAAPSLPRSQCGV